MNLLLGRADQRGVTLVELILAIAIISIALGGVLLVMNHTTSRSADPLLRYQALSVAEAYLEEISLKNFKDADADGELERIHFDDIDDYNRLPDNRVRDYRGRIVRGLESYRVEVQVHAQNFGPSGNQVGGLKIAVTVFDPQGERLTLNGYRTDY